MSGGVFLSLRRYSLLQGMSHALCHIALPNAGRRPDSNGKPGEGSAGACAGLGMDSRNFCSSGQPCRTPLIFLSLIIEADNFNLFRLWFHLKYSQLALPLRPIQ